MNSTQLVNRISHHEDLLKSFGGSMDGWEFTGAVADTGPGSTAKCGCGHAIRYVYVWEHEDGRTNATGSTCVENAPFINASQIKTMEAALEALKAKQKAARKAAKLAAGTAEVAAKVAEIKASLDNSTIGRIVAENKEVYGWVDSRVYSARYTLRRQKADLRSALSLKTPKGQLKRLASLETELRQSA